MEKPSDETLDRLLELCRAEIAYDGDIWAKHCVLLHNLKDGTWKWNGPAKAQYRDIIRLLAAV